MRTAIAASVLVAAIVVGAPAHAGPAPAISISPATGLTDFQPVQITGSGYDGWPFLEVYQCRGGATSEADCDGTNAFELDIEPDGTFSYEFYVDARIYLPSGESVDCRTDPAGCSIGVGFMIDADEWPQHPIEFDPDAPLRPSVSATVTPDADLTSGQVVTVRGEHLSFREETFAYVCGAGDEDPGQRCDLSDDIRGVAAPDGTVTLDIPVRSTFSPPLGGSVDCLTRPGGCVVVVSWGFYGPPDRRTEVPISFRRPDDVTTTTAPVSTTTAPSGAPAPPAAAPVPGQAGYTG